MCRIAGIVNAAIPPGELKSQLQAMCHVQRHGGPDDEGFYLDENGLGLAHRRLSLIDLSESGHQPMFYSDGKLVITYNGELYNYQELRKELIYLGYRFSSSSDTEVILASFAEWGKKTASTFRSFRLLNLMPQMLSGKPYFYKVL